MKRKTNPDHKLAGYSYGVVARCSCGWHSVAVFGQGARYDAAQQWHIHREKCEKEGSK